MTSSHDIERVANRDFSRARSRALRRRILALFGVRQRTLLSFDQVRSHILIRSQHDRGLQTVPISKIIGSQGRYSDFDREFLPRNDETSDRWKSIVRAYYRDVNLPAVELYQLGDCYFVVDGNHRISVARERGQIDIDAHVIEFKTDVSLTPDLDMRDLIRKEEQSDFLEWTNLAQIRTIEPIEVSELGAYLDIIRHINRHRQVLCRDRGAEVEAEEAIGHWYDTIYVPLTMAIRKRGILRNFPNRTETDLYLWIMEHPDRVGGLNLDLAPEEVVITYLERSVPRGIRGFVQRKLPGVARWFAPKRP